MEHKRVPPHDDCYSIVSKSQTVGHKEQSLRTWKNPDAQRQQEIDKVAKICQEIMISTAVVCEDADGHEVNELGRIPEVKVLRETADQISTDKDVHNAANERYLLSHADGLCIVPLPSQLVDTLAHAFSVAIELFIR
jgi:hypothetical protein